MKKIIFIIIIMFLQNVKAQEKKLHYIAANPGSIISDTEYIFYESFIYKQAKDSLVIIDSLFAKKSLLHENYFVRLYHDRNVAIINGSDIIDPFVKELIIPLNNMSITKVKEGEWWSSPLLIGQNSFSFQI
ncbi:MAG: hypothetical protein HRT66_08630 [Flavobacteriaceae bacterium]|nr:hypothetical protein [Flavobacteriaceae bacterium]